jgi:hypothetical protein
MSAIKPSTALKWLVVHGDPPHAWIGLVALKASAAAPQFIEPKMQHHQ